MANKVEILNLDINTSALISKMTDTRNEIDKLKAAQKELSNSNQSTSDSFTKNAVEIQRLQTNYNQQKAVVTQLKTASDSFASSTATLTQAIAKENTSIAAARENNTQLLAIRNQLNTKTLEGQTALTAINNKLDENNKFIKENVSGYEKQKIGIGDYKTAITGALNDTGLFGGKVQAATQTLGNFSGLFTKMKTEVADGTTQIKNSATATEGMTVAQKALTIATNIGTGAFRIFTIALAATGIGLIIGAVVLLIGYFKTFDPLIDKIEQGMAGLGAAVRVVQQALASLFLSSESSSKSFSNLGDKMAKAAKDAANLKAAQQDLLDLQNSQEVANAKASQQYDELIIKSKNRTLTDKQRIEFLKQAEAIETANFKQRSALADAEIKQAIEAARIKGALSSQELANLQKNTLAYGTYLLNAGKITEAELDALKKGELGKIAIQAESTKRLEKNQNAQDKLEDDAQAKREKANQDAINAQQKRTEENNKLIDKTIQKTKEEIDLYIASQGTRKKSMEEQLVFEQSLLDKQLAALKQQLDLKKISELTYQSESLKLKNAFAQKQIDVTVANADAELKAYLDNHKTLLDANKFLNDNLYNQELQRINDVSEAEAAAQTTRLANGVINAQQYAEAIAAIDAKAAADKKIVDDTKAADEKAKLATDLENKRIIDQENFTNQFDIDLANEEIKYQQEIANAEKTGADLSLINQKYALVQNKINEQKEQAKRDSAAATLGDLASLLGEETAAGKAAAIAQATINTYSGIAQVWSSPSVLPEPFATAQKVVSTGVVLASGLQAVRQITSTKTPKLADGGIIPTLESGLINNGSNIVPLSNGDDTLAYVGQGEVILNKEQQARAGGSMFFKSLGVKGFAGGGMVSGTSNLGSKGGLAMGIDYDLLASKMAQANRLLPAPVVSVQDISNTQNRVAVIENGANL
jgi:hypothetical protein